MRSSASLLSAMYHLRLPVELILYHQRGKPPALSAVLVPIGRVFVSHRAARPGPDSALLKGLAETLKKFAGSVNTAAMSQMLH